MNIVDDSLSVLVQQGLSEQPSWDHCSCQSSQRVPCSASSETTNSSISLTRMSAAHGTNGGQSGWGESNELEAEMHWVSGTSWSLMAISQCNAPDYAEKSSIEHTSHSNGVLGA